MFTQRDEEKYILEFFKNKTGRFLDIGAADGRCFSTTHALALKGWGGVCIEPSPSILPALHKLYDSRNDIEILETAISNITGEIDFYDSDGDMISSISKDHINLWEKTGCKFTKIKVPSLIPIDLFARIGYDFDFISLDVEGTNIDIFSHLPFENLGKVKMFCVEFDFCSEKVLELVEPFDFTLLHQTEENLLLVRP